MGAEVTPVYGVISIATTAGFEPAQAMWFKEHPELVITHDSRFRGFAITHRPMGKSICAGLAYEDALFVLELLWEAGDWSEVTEENVPTWATEICVPILEFLNRNRRLRKQRLEDALARWEKYGEPWQ